MDIYKFVNSKDIRKYLKKTNYKFNALEAAYLIYNSRNTTLEERHNAWKEVIKTMPDMEVDCKEWAFSQNSIHNSLAEYMKIENRIINIVKNSKGRFLFELREENGNKIRFSEWGYDKYTAYTFDELIKKKDVIFKKYQYTDVNTVVFYASNDTTGTYKLVLDADDQILLVETFGTKEADMMLNSFDLLWFAFPTPFKKYDIVWDPQRPDNSDLWSGPFLLTETAYDIYQRTHKKMHDSMDMTAYGYFQDENGNIYGECMHDYTSLEYYPIENLRGFQRVLIALREYLNGKKDIVDFVRTYHDLLNEEKAKQEISKYYPKYSFNIKE